MNPYREIMRITDEFHTMAAENTVSSWKVFKLNRKLKKCLALIGDNSYDINVIKHGK